MQVRLIDHHGGNLGLMTFEEARKIASSQNFYIVNVTTNITPPVYRIMHSKRSEKELPGEFGKGTKPIKKVKEHELRFGVNIEEHDVGVKVRRLREFLDKKQRVKISVIWKKRIMVDPVLGEELIRHIHERVADISNMDVTPFAVTGRQMFGYFNPIRSQEKKIEHNSEEQTEKEIKHSTKKEKKRT